MTLDTAVADALRATTTGTIHTILLKKGIRRTWMKGPRPASMPPSGWSAPPSRSASCRPAKTSRRPESWARPRSTRGAIEDMPEGCVAVVDALGVQDAGIFGDILCARMKKRGVAALVTDGAMRDGAGVDATDCRSGAPASPPRPRSRA